MTTRVIASLPPHPAVKLRDTHTLVFGDILQQNDSSMLTFSLMNNIHDLYSIGMLHTSVYTHTHTHASAGGGESMSQPRHVTRTHIMHLPELLVTRDVLPLYNG